MNTIDSRQSVGDEGTHDTYVGMGNDDLEMAQKPGKRKARRRSSKQLPEVDHSPAVDSFFNSVRIPASFLAAASLNELFRKLDDTETLVQTFLQSACTGCMWFAFVLSMNVVILSTATLNKSLAQDFNPIARTGYRLLYREFHFELVCVSWCFLVSLFGFLLAVLLRVLYKAELFNVNGENFKRNHLELGIALCLIMLSLMLHLYAYVNSTLISWNNMFDMTVDLFKLLLGRGSWENPTEVLSLGIACIGLVFIALSLVPGRQI